MPDDDPPDSVPKDQLPLGPPPPATFHHPYQPYTVQLEFMRTLYDVLAKGDNQVGILESPTGTVCLSPSCSLSNPQHNQSYPNKSPNTSLNEPTTN